MSNSVFVCYALGPGEGFSLVPLPYGDKANSRKGDRTGYIFRFLRHGEGTNEILIYRNDTGWVQKLKNVWLPSNPVKTLRRLVIEHHKNGHHFVTATFDTGARYDATFSFEDGTYPPNNVNRGMQFIVKAHSGLPEELQYRLHSWIVSDTWIESIPDRQLRLGAGNEEPKKSQHSGELDIAHETTRAMKLYEAGNLLAAREVCRDILGRDPRSSHALQLMGLISIAEEQYSDAFIHVSSALEIRRKIHGEKHAKVAESLSLLAKLYALKNPADPLGISLYMESLAVRETVLGADHPDIADNLDELAGLYKNQGNHAEALKLYQRSLAIRERLPGAGYMEVATGLVNLGRYYSQQKRYADAEPLLQRALAIAEKTYGAEDSRVREYLNYLEEVYEAQTKINDLIPIYQRLMKITETHTRHDLIYMGRRLNNMGVYYRDKGQLDEAEKNFKRAIDIWREAQGGEVEHPHLANAFYNLANLYARYMRRYSEAEPLFKKSLEMKGKMRGMDDPEIADILADLGHVYLVQLRDVEAERVLKQSLEIGERALSHHHPSLIAPIYSLALLYSSQARYTAAEPLFIRLLGLMEKARGPEHPDVVKILDRIVENYKKMDRAFDAGIYMSKAEKIRRKTGGN